MDRGHPARGHSGTTTADRSRVSQLERLGVKTPTGDIVRIAELGRFDELPAEQTIYHKNLRRMAYVTGETAGASPPAVKEEA